MKKLKYTEYINYKNSNSEYINNKTLNSKHVNYKKLNNIEELLSVREKGENYKYEKNISKINSEHDKVIKIGLENKEEVAELISRELNLKKPIKAKDIEKYKNEFIDKHFRRSQADVVYKLKRKDVFFLIEHQSSVDNLMPIRILTYQTRIMQSAIGMNNKTRPKKVKKFPTVIPIVTYIGKEKWKVQQKLKNVQEQLEGEEIYGLRRLLFSRCT